MCKWAGGLLLYSCVSDGLNGLGWFIKQGRGRNEKWGQEARCSISIDVLEK